MDEQVRNEAAEDFLSLLKEWEKLCQQFSLFGSDKELEQSLNSVSKEEEEEEEEEEDEEENDKASNVSDEEFEVERLLAVCYGDPNKVKKSGVYFKVSYISFGKRLSTCHICSIVFVVKLFIWHISSLIKISLIYYSLFPLKCLFSSLDGCGVSFITFVALFDKFMALLYFNFV